MWNFISLSVTGLALLGLFAANPSEAALVTLQVEGEVDFVSADPPIPVGIGVGRPLSGSVTYDTEIPGPEIDTFAVVDLLIQLPGSYSVTEEDAIVPPAVVDLSTTPVSLEGQFAIGNAYDVGDTILLSFSSLSGSAGTFAILDGESRTVASGSLFLTAVPLPAALPLLASGLLGLGVMARRRRT